MHTRKGSFPMGLWPARPRAGTRWSGLLLLISIVILLFHRLDSDFWFLPPPSYIPSCSSRPLDTRITSPSYNFYRNATQHHPVDSLAQLPIPVSNRYLRTQYDFSKNAHQYRETVICKRRQAVVKVAFERYWSANQESALRDKKMQQTLAHQYPMAVDGLETFWVMGMTKEFEEALAVITRMDLSPRGHVTSFLRTTRLLSALLSAHDLTNCGNSRILRKAVELGDMLYTFFDTPSRLPITSWNSMKVAGGEEQEPSGHGTLTELTSYHHAFTRLSQLTGDMRYYDAVKRVTTILASHQNSTRIPGLWPTDMNLRSLDLTSNNTFSLEDTSSPVAYAQYGLVSRLLAAPPTASPYVDISTTALDAIIQHMLFRPITPTNASILMASSAYTTSTGHITRTHTIDVSSCALGSTLALTATLTRNDMYLRYARLVTEGCIWASLHAPPASSSSSSSDDNFNTMPRSFSMLACSSADLNQSDEDCTFNADVWWEQKYPGFETVGDGGEMGIMIRPEVAMSLFALYRVTGEERWRDVGWQLWEGVERAMQRLEQMPHANGGTSEEEFKAVVQTIKYFYLLFSETDTLSLDEWVFGGDGSVLWAGI